MASARVLLSPVFRDSSRNIMPLEHWWMMGDMRGAWT
jgi:hypothetical protein